MAWTWKDGRKEGGMTDSTGWICGIIYPWRAAYLIMLYVYNILSLSVTIHARFWIVD